MHSHGLSEKDLDLLSLPASDLQFATYHRHSESLFDWDVTLSDVQFGLKPLCDDERERVLDDDLEPLAPRTANHLRLSGVEACGSIQLLVSPPGVSDLEFQNAALKGDLEQVRAMLRSGVSVNAPMRCAKGAMRSDDEEPAPRIMCKGFAPFDLSETPEEVTEFATLLHVLASRPELPNGVEIIGEVIAARADLNARSSLGSTPLAYASLHRHLGAAEALLATRADVRPLDDRGHSAMDCAKDVFNMSESTDGEDTDAMASRIVSLLMMNGASAARQMSSSFRSERSITSLS